MTPHPGPDYLLVPWLIRAFLFACLAVLGLGLISLGDGRLTSFAGKRRPQAVVWVWFACMVAFSVLMSTGCARPTRWPAPRRFHPERWPIDSAAILPATDPHDLGIREKVVLYD